MRLSDLKAKYIMKLKITLHFAHAVSVVVELVILIGLEVEGKLHYPIPNIQLQGRARYLKLRFY